MNRKQRRAAAAIERSAPVRDHAGLARMMQASEALKNGDMQALADMGITVAKLDESIALIDNGQAKGVTREVEGFLRTVRANMREREAAL